MVVVIVALLATIAMPHLVRARMAANETQTIGQLRTLANSLAMYRFAHNTYPDQWQPDMYPAGGLHFGPEMFNADLQAHISSSREAWRHAVDETIGQFTSTRVSRERAIAAARAAADPSAFQPGLFDRRSARAHLAHMATRADSEGDLAARLKAIAEAGAVSLRPPQLLLVVTP